MIVYFNGKFVKRQDAKVSIFDHGLLYGDGVFEGIRSYNCLIFKLQEHIDRLYASAQGIALKIHLSRKEMEEAIVATLKANKLKDAYIRVVVTRGEGDLGLDPRNCSEETIFIIADKIALYPKELYKNGLNIITVATRRNIVEAVNPQIKSLNYLNNILGKIEAINAGVLEAVMLNHDGFVAECTGDNIFMIKNKLLLTPPVSSGILKGITRDTILDLADSVGLEAREALFTRFDLYTAEEVFLTGTAAEIIPVIKIDGRCINGGVIGRKCLQLMERFKKTTEKEGLRYAL